MTELQFVETILGETGDYIRENYRNRNTLEVNAKSHANDFFTAVDITVQKQMVSRIRDSFPKDAILAEESGLDIYPDHIPDRCWTIDPIDGTQNFLRGLFPAFGVSIALMEQGRTVAGGVLMPISGDLFLAEAGKGAFRNGTPITVTNIADLSMARVDLDFDGPKMRPDIVRLAGNIMQKAGQIRSYACSVVGFCGVAAAEQDVYMVLGINVWDVAAGLLIVEESGGKVTRFNGSPFNPFDSRKDVLVTNGIIHAACLKEIAITES
jgi:myo-inositol-1(or 4)-monophosphatase